MKPVNVSTTARKRLFVEVAFAGLSGANVKPESPPFAAITIASSRIAPTPIAAAISWMRVEMRMSRKARSASAPRKTKNHAYQCHLIPVCADIAIDTKNEPITRTNEMPTAKPPPYSQPPRKPALGLRPREMYVYRPPALAIRRVKRTITDARHRLPTPAIRYANGAAMPASPAAADEANATPSASESSATDW